MTAIAGSGMTTATCRYSDGAGIQTFGLGASFAKSRADTDCRRVNAAQAMWASGRDIAGNRIYCTISYVHAALGDDCEALMNEQPDRPVARVQPITYTPAEVKELLDKQAQALHGGK